MISLPSPYTLTAAHRSTEYRGSSLPAMRVVCKATRVGDIMRTSAVSAAISVALIGLSLADDASAVIRMTTSIPEQPLSSALRSLAKERKFQVLFRSELVRSMRSAGAVGEFTTVEALEHLLGGTSLTYRYLDERTVTIEPKISTELSPPDALVTAVAEDPVSAIPGSRASGAESTAATDEPGTATQPHIELEEIVVTGSHIRGAEHTGSPVSIITRADIDASGYTTVQDILKTFTANSGAGPSEVLLSGTEQGTAFNAGGSINLRGLGASSTLVLVNGRRQPGGGLESRYVDVASIPSAAIERIEILTDGASAVYGSDAVAGVVNIILRRDFEGAETRIRAGDVSGGADELLFGQLLGDSWGSGHAMVSYQFWSRDSLPHAARYFAADSDKRPLGGDSYSFFESNPGNIIDPATGVPVYPIPRGQDGRGLEASDLIPGSINYQNRLERADLLPSQKMHSFLASGSQQIGERLRLIAEASFSQRTADRNEGAASRELSVPSSNPFYIDVFGTGEPVSVAYSFIDDLGPLKTSSETRTYSATVGATLTVAGSWTVDAYASYGAEGIDWHTKNLVSRVDVNRALADSNPATAFNPFGDGSFTNSATLDTIRMTQIEKSQSRSWSTNAVAQGDLFHLSGGAVKLAAGADYRSERLDRMESLLRNSGNFILDPTPVDRQIASAFTEIQLPLVSAANRRRGLEQLTLSLAGRYERYSDFGSTVNPKFGLSWSPVDAVRVRASAGTSFKAPNLLDINENPILYPNSSTVVLVTDPKSPTGFSRILFLGGSNDGLKEERATTWTAGMDFLPESLPGFNISLTYFNILYKDHIERGGPPSVYSIFSEEDRWASIITRNPPRSLVEHLCSQATHFGSLEECLTGELPTIVDARVRNLGELKVRGVDASLRFPMATSVGAFALSIDGSYVLQFDQAPTNTSPFVDLVDTLGGPVRLRLRAAIDWTRGPLRALVAVNHQNSYIDNVSSPRRDVDTLTTVDAQVGYVFVEKTELALSAINVLDEDPPFVNSIYGYDPANASPIGRAVAVQLTKSW
jgi:iron complex outermembrane recepter protein